MRKTVLATLLLLLLVSGCCSVFCPAGIEGERLAEVNQQWWEFYTSHRRPTPEEVQAYDALDDAAKEEWRRAGKPVDRPLLELKVDAVQDFKKAVDMEAEAAD
jgi:hypothetical protein